MYNCKLGLKARRCTSCNTVHFSSASAFRSRIIALRPIKRTSSVASHTRNLRAQSQPQAIERLEGLRPEVEDAIDKSRDSCLVTSDLRLGKQTVGKVRDTYDLGDKLLIVTTDRQSAFDRLLAAIPFKGQVLNQTSCWWMDQTKHIVPNALLSVPDPNAALMQKCRVFPVEFVVRGFLTGSTETSLWTHYSQGKRTYCGNSFPDGMKKNDRLKENVITPTTKAADHDVPISPEDIIAQGLMKQDEWDQVGFPKYELGIVIKLRTSCLYFVSYQEQVSQAAIRLFEFGQSLAESRGLLLVDTKYEFGMTQSGEIVLVDEIHTPDSSRYWISDTYEDRHAQGLEPQSIDKEFLRLWFRKNCDPYKDKVLPEAPADLVTELSRRYIMLFEKITQQEFKPASSELAPADRLKTALQEPL